MAALTVTGSSCRRQSGHRSIVPPARSIRVGARVSTRSGIETPGRALMPCDDVLRFVFRLSRYQNPRLAQPVDRERVKGVADIGRQAHRDAVELEDSLDQLRLEVAPGAVDDGGHHGRLLALKTIIAAPREEGQPRG